MVVVTSSVVEIKTTPLHTRTTVDDTQGHVQKVVCGRGPLRTADVQKILENSNNSAQRARIPLGEITQVFEDCSVDIYRDRETNVQPHTAPSRSHRMNIIGWAFLPVPPPSAIENGPLTSTTTEKQWWWRWCCLTGGRALPHQISIIGLTRDSSGRDSIHSDQALTTCRSNKHCMHL